MSVGTSVLSILTVLFLGVICVTTDRTGFEVPKERPTDLPLGSRLIGAVQRNPGVSSESNVGPKRTVGLGKPVENLKVIGVGDEDRGLGDIKKARLQSDLENPILKASMKRINRQTPLEGRIVNKNDAQRKQDPLLEMDPSKTFVKIMDHTIVQVNPQSTLMAAPGQVVSIYFDVTNVLNIPVFYTFRAEDQQSLIRNIFPARRWIESHRTEVITVVLETHMHQADTDTIIFIAQLGSGADVAIRKVYFRTGQQIQDTTSPDIDYSYNGDCRDALTPQTCTTASWGADITVYDGDSGLLSVTSFPLGLQYRGEFIAGTRDKVYLHYSSSCCDTKVDIIATDIKGNTYKRTINVERQWWTVAEIAAIVTGIILLLILIVLVIVGIIACCRQRASRDFSH